MYVPVVREDELIVMVELLPAQTAAAEVLKLVTFGNGKTVANTLVLVAVVQPPLVAST